MSHENSVTFRRNGKYWNRTGHGKVKLLGGPYNSEEEAVAAAIKRSKMFDNVPKHKMQTVSNANPRYIRFSKNKNLTNNPFK